MPFVAPPNFTAGVLVTETHLDALSDDLTAGVLRPLAETTLAVATASVVFSAIPATFRNLLIMMHARGTAAATAVQVAMRMNGDTASANYHSQALHAAATTPAATEQAPSAMSGVWIGDIPAASAPSGIMYGGFEIRVHDYRSAQEKGVISSGSSRSGGAGSNRTYVMGGVWISASVITSLELYCSSGGNFEAFSRFSLYGEPALP